MAQWVNRLWNKIFVNLLPLPLSCEISGALHLLQPGLMAGKLAGRLADEIQVNFENIKIACGLKLIFEFSFCLTKIQHHYSLTNAFQWVFWIKPIARWIFKA